MPQTALYPNLQKPTITVTLSHTAFAPSTATASSFISQIPTTSTIPNIPEHNQNGSQKHATSNPVQIAQNTKPAQLKPTHTPKIPKPPLPDLFDPIPGWD